MNKNKKNNHLVTKILATTIWVIIIVGIIVAIVLYKEGLTIISDSPTLNIDDFLSQDSSRIYDSDNNVIAEEGLYLKENITYDEMPECLIDAFLSIEDSRFFSHYGFDVSRFSKALLENIKTGSFGQGGSTLTMQLVKNTYFTIDDGDDSTIATKSINRKVQEIYLALKLETESSKKEIFEMYLNKLNFGGNIRGVEKAAEYYFGKNASDLNLQEASILAGIVNRPNEYSPYAILFDNSMDAINSCTTRRNEVLAMMKYHGYINEKEYELAKSIKVEDSLLTDENVYNNDNNTYQSYIDTVVSEAYELTGKDPTTYPMEIHTYMDADIQTLIRNIQTNNSEIVFNRDNIQSAIVSMNNQTGAILGIGGGNDQYDARMLNRATSSYIQPGSSVKPFLSYALAFEYLNYSTKQVITDEPITYRGTDILIHNFSGNYSGDVTMEDALARSLNIPAMKLLQEVNDKIGSDAVVQYLQSIGFSQVTKEKYNLGYAIGGSSFIVTPVELAGAHAMLVNKGVYIKPHTIDYIMIDGQKIEPDKTGTRVLSEEAAYLSLSLEDYAVNGPYDTGMSAMASSDYRVYGKTGTSDWGDSGLQYNIPDGSAKDYWMVGSTSKYTNVVWLGYDQGVIDEHTYFTMEDFRINLRGQISNLMLENLNKNQDIPNVEQPAGVKSISYTLGTYPYAACEGIGTCATALIKATDIDGKSNLNLVSVYDANNVPTTLDNLAGSYTSDGTVKVIWPNVPFYDEASGKWVKELALNSEGKLIESSGNVLFSYAWAGFTPHFVGQIFVNGAYFKDIYSESAVYWDWIEPSTTNSVKACGYYYYDSGKSSPQVCIDLK